MLNQHLHLKGRFKFDLYDRSGNLRKSTSVDNFITPSGLSYPMTLPFADCFRYLSLGSGTTANSNSLGADTTGLAIKLPAFAYIGGNRSEEGGPNQYELEGCGYREHKSGVVLSRSWRVPSTTNSYFTGEYVFKEAMVSPGKPTVASECQESSDMLALYPNLCTYTKAFSRIIGDISVENDNYLVVSYELNISTNTGVNFFSLSIDHDTNEGDAGNWEGTLRGYYGIVHHGVNLVRGSDTNAKPFNVEQDYYYQHYGDSFIGPLGNPLEPSCPSTRYRLYLSTDNTQFLVSELSGAKMNTGLYRPYNSTGKFFPSGIEYFHSQPTVETTMGNSVPYWLVNIRKSAEGAYYPCPDNFKNSCVDSTVQWIADDGITTHFDTFAKTDRTRSKKITAEIRNTSVPGGMVGQPIKSLVFGYKGRDTSNIYPFLDMIFGNEGENPIRPPVFSNTFTYSNYSDYNVLDGVNNLTIDFRLYWSSPCPQGMSNCT